MTNKFSLVALILFVFVACNKDEEIISDNPDINPGPQDPPAAVINYRVVEYTPAPGQYINEQISGFENVFTQEEACRQAQNRLTNNQYVSLGAWGGYIVIKFDESVSNSGDYDFAISSNAFDTSNEPGIVWVMKDTNGNGMADDEWYELKGSHFGKEGYERNYWVTYQRPAAKEDTPWEDSNGEKGIVKWMGNYHSQDFYYPNWVKEDSYTLYGSRLPAQVYQDPETGVWTNFPFDWGYADNFGVEFESDGHKNYFRISDAVTEDNDPANLSSIDFVKVQTAVNSTSGWLGENSTEVCGFFSL